MIEVFREDPEEFKQDLAEALERHGAKKPGEIARRWANGHLRKKLETMRSHFPPALQMMFALRDYCSKEYVKDSIQLAKSHDKDNSAEYLATALGYATGAGGSSVALIPSDVDELTGISMQFAKRTVNRGGGHADKRARHIAHSLVEYAKEKGIILSEKGAEFPAEVLQVKFRINLMQALAIGRFSKGVMVSLGWNYSTANRLLAKHQVGARVKCEDGITRYDHDGTNIYSITTVNDALRLVRTESRFLAMQYLGIYGVGTDQQDRICRKLVKDASNLKEIARETDGVYGRQRHRRSSVEMFARAVGAESLEDERLNRPRSALRRSLKKLLCNMGVERIREGTRVFKADEEVARTIRNTAVFIKKPLYLADVVK